MQNIKWFLKNIIYIFLHILWIVPIKKNRIYFTAFHGLRFSCNSKYIYLYLIKKFNNKYEYIWEFQDCEKSTLVPDAKTVCFMSLKSILAILTSKYIFTNNDFPWWIPLRKSQVFVQLWHGGGAYKKVGVNENWSNVFVREQEKIAKEVTYYVSSSQKFTEVQSPSKKVPVEKFISTGMPRNEIFFNSNTVDGLRNKVFTNFNIPDGKRIILYAPTFRGKPIYKTENNSRNYGVLNYENLVTSFKEKFSSDFVILYRGHHVDSNLKNNLPSFVLDATQYEDMQELLCAADVLITDYSSTMWDFAITKKPCFLYTPDLKDYDTKRGFYTNPHTWPFPIAETEEDLWNNIRGFDEKTYEIAAQKHLDDFGSYENANACEKICIAVGLMKENQ